MGLSFETLECWKKAKELRVDLTRVINRLPREEKYDLVSQPRRSARSVTANIAEGSGRFYYQENIAFCRKSRGSLFEIKDHLLTAVECGYLSDEELNQLGIKVEECVVVLNGYIKYMQKKKQE